MFRLLLLSRRMTSIEMKPSTTHPVSAVLFVFLLSVSAAVADAEHVFGQPLNVKALGLKKQKLSHFRFYWHDVLSGKNPTSMTVVQPHLNVSGASTGFGIVNMIDNPLTISPEMSSRLVGRAQGFYALASQEELGLLMVMNFAFIEGKYNGSTITVMGRNNVINKVRELPVVGGSGVFRFARGYAELRTHSFDPKTGDANVEYNVYVMHF